MWELRNCHDEIDSHVVILLDSLFNSSTSLPIIPRRSFGRYRRKHQPGMYASAVSHVAERLQDGLMIGLPGTDGGTA